MSIGLNIKRLREEKGMTQEELAEVACVSRSMIAQIERDSRCPTMILGSQIADVLDVDIKDLIGTRAAEQKGKENE